MLANLSTCHGRNASQFYIFLFISYIFWVMESNFDIITFIVNSCAQAAERNI